jgi:hypothetical protein
MKRHFKTVLLACLAMVCRFGHAQGFVNLDFEAAQNVPGSNGYMASTDALPGWTAFSGASQLSDVFYINNITSPPYPPVELVGWNGINWRVIDGNYSCFLNNGGLISQTATVPADTESLIFKDYVYSGYHATMSVSLGGQNLSLITISNTPNYKLVGADISAFAGQTVTLSFSASSGGYNLDGIQFSSQLVPEPGTLGLLALGGSLCGGLYFRRK